MRLPLRLKALPPWTVGGLGGLVVLLSLAIWPVGASAQGPERLQPFTFIPSMTITGRYDTNITQARTGVLEDYSTIYSPGAEIVYRLPHTVLSGNFLWDFEEFDDFTDLNNLDQSGSGSLTHVFSPFLSFSAGFNYSRNESEDVDLDLTVQGRLAESARALQSSETIGADAAIQLDYLARLPVTLTYAFSDEQSSAADEVDSLSHVFGARASYLLVPARGHSLDLSYTASIKEEDTGKQLSPSEAEALNFAAIDLTEHIATIAYTHRFDPSLSATGGGGVSVVAHSSTPRLEGDVDPVFFASLTKRWVRTGLALNWSMDTGRGGGFGGTTTSNTVGLVADHSPIPNLSLALNLNFEEADLENDATGLDRDELRFLVSPSISYRLLRYFVFSGSYTYSRLDYDDKGGAFVPGSEFQEFTASLSIVLRHGLPHFTVDYSYSENDSEEEADDFDREVLYFSVSYSLPVSL